MWCSSGTCLWALRTRGGRWTAGRSPDFHKTKGRPCDRIELSEMRNQRGERPVTLIAAILHQDPRLDRDLFQIDAQMWAILGYIPVDGEVILAQFDQRETARAVLAQLAAAQDRDGSE